MVVPSGLRFELLAKCSVSKAKAGIIHLPHYHVQTPVFMPVGTQGTMKGLTSNQLKDLLDCEILLGNTYHLGYRPGWELLESFGGLHHFMNWDRAILTDSGGFQMVSLLSLASISEQGVTFSSPRDNSLMLLTPEESIQIQNAIGADIIMQLDDVTNPLSTDERLEEAMYRSVRWLDRCISAHKYPSSQNLFPIIQGGLNTERRLVCLDEMIKRNAKGYAIGGLGGGEDKSSFTKMVKFCTDTLPNDKPIYCMGIGYDTDLLVCIALGVDMFDCVFPTRTARFGHALISTGDLSLKQNRYAYDLKPIDETCSCLTCRRFSRAFLHSIIGKETVACHYLSIHNLHYMFTLMRNVRQAIKDGTFPLFVKNWYLNRFGRLKNIPSWIVAALESVNIHFDSEPLNANINLSTSIHPSPSALEAHSHISSSNINDHSPSILI